MTKKVFDRKFGQRRIVSFDNGVQLTGGNKSISTILDIINHIGKVLKEDKSAGHSRRKGVPKPRRKSESMPKMKRRDRDK